MRLQKIEYDGAEDIRFVRYAGSMAEARLARASLVEQFGVKIKDVHIDMENIATGKDATIEFINHLAARGDRQLAARGDRQPGESFGGTD